MNTMQIQLQLQQIQLQLQLNKLIEELEENITTCFCVFSNS
jgi:hypothetical protein